MSEWNYKPTPRDCIYITEWFDKFKDKQTNNQYWHEPRWIKVHEKGEMIGGYWDCGSFQCSDEFMQKLLVHPAIRENAFTGVWIDEFVDLWEKDHNDKKQRKQQKPKYKVPFWANDWRNR